MRIGAGSWRHPRPLALAAHALLLVAAGAFGLASPAWATGSADADPGMQAPPGSVDPADIDKAWSIAVSLERSVFDDDNAVPDVAIGRLARAATLFEGIGEAQGGATQGFWRASRATWLTGEFLPLDDTVGRLDRFQRALELADRGIAENVGCAECMLWKFISMGRLRTTAGIWEGMRQVSEMAEILDRAIALEPTHRDGNDNSTLGNLHYSAAIFYRLVPDWFWLRWVLGVRGDKERALEHSRTALALHPKRLEYQIEVGTQLLCLGADKGDARRLVEGQRVMRQAIERIAKTQDEAREIRFARIMLADPQKACGYSGDKILEVDESKAKSASR